MPVIKSAEKQLRKNLKAREKNQLQKEEVKKSIKKMEKLLKAKKYEDAKKIANDVYSKIDRMAKRKIIHHNTAARKKSHLAKWINRGNK